jgi:hypothetical protein
MLPASNHRDAGSSGDDGADALGMRRIPGQSSDAAGRLLEFLLDRARKIRVV